MFPVLFTLPGGFAIHSYGVMGAVGFLVVCVIAIARAAALGLVRERVADVIFWTSFAAVAGSRALYVLENPEQFDGPVTWVNLRTGGLVFYGAVLVGFPTAIGLMRWFRLPVLTVLDVFATALPLGHALSRMGCLLAGCCYGSPSRLPWAITFTDPLAQAPHGVPLHPTQAYEALYLLVITIVTNTLYPRRRFDGQVMATYLLLYAILRAVNELFRADPTRGWFLAGVLGELVSTSQAVSAVVAAVAIAALVGLPRREPG